MRTNSILIVLNILLFSITVSAYSGGITGKTMKSGTSGCSCHGSASSSVITTITGPAQLTVNMQSTYTVTISGGPLVGGGVDIAASLGTLAIVSSDLRSSSSELTQSNTKISSGSVVTFQFQYTAPATTGTQTLYATGISVNNTSGTSGDAWSFAPNFAVNVVSATGINDNINPLSFYVSQNYPNPFNPSTTISYTIPENIFVNIKVYNVLGQEVAMLENSMQLAGTHQINFNAEKLESGVYYYSVKAGNNFVQTRKMILIK